MMNLTLNVNGLKKFITTRGSDTLLQVLREEFGLTGAKPGCRNGDCGCCTVLVDGEPIHACLMLAVEAAGHDIITIEGLKDSPIPKAFIDHSAFQCGYCTPGFVVNAHALVSKHPNASDQQIEDWFKSNLCRCTGYAEIRSAVKAALEEAKS